MKDIRLHFDGKDDTVFDFRTPVEGRALYEQKALLNLATEKGSDPLYAARGTNLMADALGGVVVSSTAAAHSGNFAALDTSLFINAEEYAAVAGSPDRIKVCQLYPIEISSKNQMIAFDVQFTFVDGTKNKTTLSV